VPNICYVLPQHHAKALMSAERRILNMDIEAGQPPAGEYLDRLYVDTVGSGFAPLEYCYAQLGAGRLLFGSDHPYAVPGVPGQLVDRLPCTPAERQQILAGNALLLLRLDTATAEHA
jgi:predicted TIM-barrel fold metal-dependent hydrolase